MTFQVTVFFSIEIVNRKLWASKKNIVLCLPDCHIKGQGHSIFLNVGNISSTFFFGGGRASLFFFLTVTLRQILMEVLKVV